MVWHRLLLACLVVGLLVCSSAQSLGSISSSLAQSAQQAASLAAALSSGSNSMGSSMGSMMGSGGAMDGMPVTMAAAPLDSQGIPDPLDSGDSQCDSMGSSMGSLGSSLGSLSALSSSMGSLASSLGSLSGSAVGLSAGGSSSGSDGGCTTCCGGGPCGGSDDPEPAKIVNALNSGAKKFVAQGSKSIWSFGENAPHTGPSKNELEMQELDKMAAQDPELQLMIHSLEQAKTKLEQEKAWVDDVKNVITHYRAKIGAVTIAMKQQAKGIWTLKAQIIAKRKQDARKLLEQKLARVQAQLKSLQDAASNVSGEARNLTQLKGSLSRSISSIEGEISKLKNK